MNANKALWEKGDFTRIAATMRASGEALVREAGIGPGLDVLDLGCGDGTTAIPAARLGANVMGIDISRYLVAAANARARAAGVADRCQVLEGDACELLGVENGSFDRVVSIFGAMFAPRPFDVAREMVRVTRPGPMWSMKHHAPTVRRDRRGSTRWTRKDPTCASRPSKISSSQRSACSNRGSGSTSAVETGPLIVTVVPRRRPSIDFAPVQSATATRLTPGNAQW